MRKPRDLRVYDRNEYWNRIDTYKAVSHKKMPEWAFDFVSIHKNGTFSLCAPLCLVDATTGLRPYWEEYRFSTKSKAILFAKWIARQTDTFILDCY